MKNPVITKFKKPGDYLRAKFKYLKFKKVYSSAREISETLGFYGRGNMYNLFHHRAPIDLKKIKLYKKTFKLNKEEEEFLILLICLNKSETPLEKKIFRAEISKRLV